MRPTFLGFETGRKGLSVVQKGLDIVGHNLSNIGTPGYTRQRVDQVSVAVTSSSQCEIGKITKSVMKEISRLDDPARIDAIQKAADDGTYQISASAVADSILQHIFME